MRILYIIKDSPTTTLGHAADRARHFLEEWKKLNVEVTCLCPDSGVERSFPEKIFGFFQTYHTKRSGRKFQKKILKTLESGKFDWIVAEELFSAWIALPASRQMRVPLAYIAHNFESHLYRQISDTNNWIEKKRFGTLERIEKNVLLEAQKVFAFSEDDRSKLQDFSGRKNLDLTRAGTAKPSFLRLTDRSKILIIGALDYFPNVEGLKWYAEKVHPLVKNKCSILVAGRNPSSHVKEICAKAGFDLLDSPKDISVVLNQGLLEIVPLLSGSGTRGKILEAAAYQIPILSTSLGAEGLGFENNKNIVLADTPEGFARNLDILLNSAIRRNEISREASQYVEKFYYPNVVQDLTASLSKS